MTSKKSMFALCRKGLLCAALLLSSIGAGTAAADSSLADSPASHTVRIDPGTVIQEDFRGVGVNVIPSSLMPGTTQFGYTDTDWEIDKKRIVAMKPKVARVWFQVDWMEKTKGNYDWESAEMQAFYKYLDAFQAAGTEIELNFGWKNGSAIHDWFVLPGVDPYISAPADLDAFARSASAALSELIDGRGYDNIKYLTFYNEPNGNWDYETTGDQKAYYAEMVRKVSQQLSADGLRDRIEIWAPEETGAPDWTAYMAEHASEHIDGYSFHVYGASYESVTAAMNERIQAAAGKPVHLTEFGWSDDGMSGWEAGFANHVIQAANVGVKSALVWQLKGVWPTDPFGDTNGNYTMWDSTVQGMTPKKAFYSAGMLARYVPAHSTVVKVDTGSPDLRAAAFKTERGDFTIVLESKAGSRKDITFDFGGMKINKTFRKFVYSDDAVRDGNALLPSSSGAFKAKSSFRDTNIGPDYNVIVYTTEAPQTQIKLTPIETTVAGKGTIQLSAELLDNNGAVKWSVIGEGNGTISSKGLYTAPDVATQRQVAIKAASSKDPASYNIAKITVTPASTPGKVDAPMFSLPYGVYNSAEAVTVTSSTPGAEIRYTTDGSIPTASSRLYTGPVILNNGTVQLFQAIAIKPGMQDSGVTSAYYRIRDISNAPDGYQFCTYEGGFCDFEGEAVVAYGAEGLFNYAIHADGAACSDEVFGDPSPNSAKRCYYSKEIPEELPLVTFYNAGFEKPATGNTRVGPFTNGWVFGDRTGIMHNGSVFENPDAPQGIQAAYLKTDGGVAGQFSQKIQFKEGTYQMSFQAAKRTSFGGLQTFDVYFDDIVIGSYAPSSGTYMTFTTDSFTASAGEHTIKFVATTTEGDNTAYIDDIRIGSPQPPKAPAFANAGFESPSTNGAKAGPMTDGWVFNNRAGVQRNGSAFGAAEAPEGIQTGLLQSKDGEQAEIKQSLYFPAGAYAIRFQAAKRGGFGGPQSFDVYVDDTRIGSYQPATTAFEAYTTDVFTVSSGNHTVTFRATTTAGDNTAFIDDVQIVVP